MCIEDNILRHSKRLLPQALGLEPSYNTSGRRCEKTNKESLCLLGVGMYANDIIAI